MHTLKVVLYKARGTPCCKAYKQLEFSLPVTVVRPVK